ncbi:MAG: hypothetical protein PHC98_01625 [Syntrophotalea acetylenica]|nr:hypothetical protein [Syntrophotalea acetylenica]
MQQHFFLHIGQHKTGTSSIQAFMDANREKLANNGIFFPALGRFGSHHDLIIADPTTRLPEDAQREAWQRYINEAQASGCKKVVISSEDLAFRATQEDVRQIGELLNGHTVTVLIFIRRNDLLMQSWYIQKLKWGAFTGTPEELIQQSPMPPLEMVNRWAEVFGEENIRVVPFERASITPSLNHVFWDLIEEEMDESYVSVDSKDVSPSGERLAAMALLAKMRSSGMLEDSVFHSILSLVRNAPSDMFPVRKKGSIFSPELQRKLMKAYEEDYRELAIRYLGREDGVFFQEPWVVDEEVNPLLGGIPSLSPDSVASLLMLMQRDHQRKVDRLKRKTLSGRLKRLFK